MQMLNAVTVYCSSSKTVPQIYFDSATQLGRAIAKNNWTLVYGGNCIGCMDSLARGVRENRGKVIGVTPKLMLDEGTADRNCNELIVTDSMRERKKIMEERGDAFIALPGGLGTFEEIFEIIVGRQLGYHDKPIILLNIARYYDPLLAMIDHGIEHHFIKPKSRQLFFVAEDVESAVAHLRQF